MSDQPQPCTPTNLDPHLRVLSDIDAIVETANHHPPYSWSMDLSYRGPSSQGFFGGGWDSYTSTAGGMDVASDNIDTSTFTPLTLDSQSGIASTCINPRLLYSAPADAPAQDTAHHGFSAGSAHHHHHVDNAPLSDNNRPFIMPTTPSASSVAAHHEPQALIPYATRTYTVYANAGILYLSLGPSHSGVRVDVHLPAAEDNLAPTFMMMDAAPTAATPPGEGVYSSEYQQPRAYRSDANVTAVADVNLFAHREAQYNSVQDVPQAENWVQYSNV